MTHTPEMIIEYLDLNVSSVFVPWSKSRNKNEKNKSLNWIVTLKRGDRQILETEYSAGIAHCPSYKNGYKKTKLEMDHISAECESGRSQINRKPILPDTISVIWSLLMETDAIEMNFEEWAENYGYDPDSRSAERIYLTCVDIARQMIGAFTPTEIDKLREAYQDY